MFGVLVVVRRPNRRWYAEAKAEGMVGDNMVEYPRIQIYTVQDMFNNKPLTLPAPQPQRSRGPQAKRGLQKRP